MTNNDSVPEPSETAELDLTNRSTSNPLLPFAPPESWESPVASGEIITSLSTGNTYTMGGKIGEGFFGVVYACKDVWNNDLAAKAMKPLAPSEKVRESAVSELQKLLYLRHPYITYVFDAFEYKDTVFLITERCYGPLTDVIKIEDFNGLLWIKAIARCLLQAVDFIHTNDYVHQDIHLGNVLAAFVRDEMNANDPGAIQFKLGDLGVAKLSNEIDASNTRAQWMLPPEILEESEFGPIDRRLDIYHCGLLLLNVVFGRELQFDVDDIKAGKPRELALHLPQPYNFALEKALRRHVPYRTQSAMELWRDLNSPEPDTSKNSLESGLLNFETEPDPT